MMAWPLTGPMPGSASSCSKVAELILTAAKAMLDMTSSANASKNRFIAVPPIDDGRYTPLQDKNERRGINAPRILRVDLGKGKAIAQWRQEGRGGLPGAFDRAATSLPYRPPCGSRPGRRG